MSDIGGVLRRFHRVHETAQDGRLLRRGKRWWIVELFFSLVQWEITRPISSASRGSWPNVSYSSGFELAFNRYMSFRKTEVTWTVPNSRRTGILEIQCIPFTPV